MVFEVLFLKLFISIRPQRTYNMPLQEEELVSLSRKSFAPSTLKKIKWATGMYDKWRLYRNQCGSPEYIGCDLNNPQTITVDGLLYAMCRFITEVKKLDGSDFPAKTLYDIVICVQFHLETMGFSWHLLNEDKFNESQIYIG